MLHDMKDTEKKIQGKITKRNKELCHAEKK
jgi:hypothetical protein